MFLITALSKKFKNVANPQKFFRKSIIATAFAACAGTYGTAGYLAWDSIKAELDQKNLEVHRLLPTSLAYNHGKNVTSALAISYVGDVALIYGLTGIGYWRNRRRKEKIAAPIP